MKILTGKEVCEKLRISESTLRRYVERGLFPEPFTITGSRPLLWIESEINAITNACIRASEYTDNAEYEKIVKKAVLEIQKNRLKNIK